MVQGVVIEDGCIVNTNPATGQVISRVPCTTPDQVDEIVKNAQVALVKWSALEADARMDLLRKSLRALGKESERLVSLMVEEMGKPISEAREELEGAVAKDEFMDLLQSAQQPQKFGSSLVVRQALGVVVVLSPWNFPVDEILLLALPALAAGNTGMSPMKCRRNRVRIR